MFRLLKENGLWQLDNIFILTVIFITNLVNCNDANSPWKNKLETTTPLGHFQKAAVTSSAQECADIGADMLAKNGSAVDAAIATLLCEGVVSSHSMGLGGGFQMTIWNATTKTAHYLIAREKASRHAKPDMFKENHTLSQFGGLAVAVPGEIAGYWEAHKRFGKLDWNELFQPSIALCENGFKINYFVDLTMGLKGADIRAQPSLAKLFINPMTNETFKLGEIMKRPVLGDTLKKLSASDGSGVRDFYNGSMARNLIGELQELGGILDEEDFRNYRVSWRDPIKVDLKNLTIFTSPPPGSGALLALIMNVLEGFVFEGDENTTYQRIAETFKWAYARRTELGDSDFEPEVDKFVQVITSKEYAERIRSNIKDNWTSQDPKFYGAETYSPVDHGTYQSCILAPDGSAVSVTSTINDYFGASFRSESTGIIFNNEMDDFSYPNITNLYGVPPSPTNFIKPGKRPFSSMSPTIVVDENNEVRLVIGAVGGTKITTSVALSMILHFWAGYNIKEAVEAHRIHHQLLPMYIQIEPNFPASIQEHWKSIGHNVTFLEGYPNLVAAISQQNGTISAYSDYRRKGKISGF